MSIDTEGSEEDILRTFDFVRYDLRAMTVEHSYTANRDAIHDLLTAPGFLRKFAEVSRRNDWCLKIL
jgi:hypothetical protein